MPSKLKGEIITNKLTGEKSIEIRRKIDYGGEAIDYAFDFLIGLFDHSNPNLRGKLVIPDTLRGLSVIGIGKNACRGSGELDSITFPASLIYIGDYAFAGCAKLKSVTFPDSVENIGKGAFHNCDNLKSVTMSRKTKIEGYPFPDHIKITYRD